MSLTAAAIRVLAEKGLTANDIAAVAEAMEGFPTVSGAPYAPRHNDCREHQLPLEEWVPLRNAIIERDGAECAYCDSTQGHTLTADHIIPLRRGGSNHPANLVCCCVPCNNSKSDRLLTEWVGRSTANAVRDFSHLEGREG